MGYFILERRNVALNLPPVGGDGAFFNSTIIRDTIAFLTNPRYRCRSNEDDWVNLLKIKNNYHHSHMH